MKFVLVRLSALHALTLGALVFVAGGCKVDETGLGTSQPRLQRDGSAPMPEGGPPNFGGDTGSSTGGTGGDSVSGTGGDTTSTGGTGAGVGTGGDGLGGSPVDSGGTTGSGGSTATGGTGGVVATGGTTGTGGVTATGGSTATGGTGGATATGGSPGTGGITPTGGTTGGGGGGPSGGTGGTTTPPPPPTCGPSNCSDGCCQDNKCNRARNESACGLNGVACKTCGSCELCSAGSCQIDPSSNWTVVAYSASVPMSPPGGGNWDAKSGQIGGPDPDLFCQFEQPAKATSLDDAGTTDTVKDVFSATWNQIITPMNKFITADALTSGNTSWRIWVGDDDGCGLGGCSGQLICSIDNKSMAISPAMLKAGGASFNNIPGCLSLNLLFDCAN
ncbi:MAG TPA: hypothetical protein VHJ20_07320 [Polyangia bacterium]|nr:hypothetical protein [Polyangia bacterium]